MAAVATDWSQAVCLADMCRLTVDWLEGRTDRLPAYEEPCDVDEAPGLREGLVVLNRAGLLTDGSQEGVDAVCGGRRLVQYAGVTGFADDAGWEALQSVVGHHADLETFAHPGAKRFRVLGRGLPGVWVTFVDNRPFTNFGRQLAASDLRWMYEECPPVALDALCAAWQFTVIDTERGRNTLWPLLIAGFGTR